MQTGPPLSVFIRLIEAGDAVDRGDAAAARAVLDDILAMPEPVDAVDRAARVFAHALSARLKNDHSGGGNLYEQAAPLDMLGAFQVLARATPIVRFGHDTANTMLVEALPDDAAIALVDIGIGSGVQWHLLFDRLAASGRRWRTLRLVGIDVPGAAGDARQRLDALGRTLAERAAAMQQPFDFTPVVGLVERLDLQAIVAPRADEQVAINAALALHHVPDIEGEASRDCVLDRLHALRPAVVTLVEPDVEHNALPFRTRLVESLVHYVTVFDALDANLGRHPAERVTLETAFFGREIVNIVAGEGLDRVERHERSGAWAARFRRHGFEPMDVRHLAAPFSAASGLAAPWALAVDGDAPILTWRDQHMLAASAWRAAR